MRVLVTGGAGYVGAHVTGVLRGRGHEVAVIDDLSTGDAGRLDGDVAFRRGSILDQNFVAETLRDRRVECVIHLAAKKAVDESLAYPLMYYRENVVGMYTLLSAMVQCGVRKLILSSSAAVYGPTSDSAVTEAATPTPASPYGRTKLFCERMIQDVAHAENMSWVALRYFNVAGAAAPALGDRGQDNLIPKVFRAISGGVSPKIFGRHYPTPDGTCIRDYVHVGDVADAHAAALRHLEFDDPATIYNVGTGHGTSVLEVLLAAKRITGLDFSWDYLPPRPGDPPSVVADVSKIQAELQWHSNYSLDDILDSAWHAFSRPTKD